MRNKDIEEDIEEVVQDMYRHNFCSFIRFAFQIQHPGVPYLDNWHVELLADHLARVERGAIKRLIINTPPRMLKSFCASIALPAWMLGRDPTKRILCLSAGVTLGKDLEESFHELMKSHRYRSVFPDRNITEKATKLQTPYGGYRRSLSMGAKLSGIPADVVIIDDPISTSDALDDKERERVNQQFDENVLQRLNNKKDGAIIVVMQRLHEDDLSGHLLKKEGWAHLDLSAFATKDEEWQLSAGRIITRNPLDALHPERESFEELMKIRYSIGGYAFACQYLQLQMPLKYGAIIVPREYESYEEWEEADPYAVFKERFLRDHGLIILPEVVPAKEWEALYGEKALGTWVSPEDKANNRDMRD